MIGYSRPVRTLGNETSLEVARLARLAPRPATIAQTGLSPMFLSALTLKHLTNSGAIALGDLTVRLGLPGVVVEQVLQSLRSEGLVEVRSRLGPDGELRYGLTERGRSEGLDALMHSGYIGPAPVPLEEYCDLVTHQSSTRRRIDRDMLQRALADSTIESALVEQLGPAVNSGRAMLLYGLPGTGKTFVSHQLARVLADFVLIPHAIIVQDTVVELFDAQVHVRVNTGTPPQPVELAQGWDARYVCCERPVVTAGGELTLEMLEIQRDPVTRRFSAPLQLKANNGVFLIDDLGRQRVPARALIDRWIVPLEERRDYLSAGAGEHFAVPFDEMLVFSTNIDPREIADESFLRRIGYKIRFQPCTREQYEKIWAAVCKARNVEFDPFLLIHVVSELYAQDGIAMLPCHPRDLIGMAINRKTFLGEAVELDEESIDWAWANYFVTADAGGHSRGVQRGRS